MSSEAITLTILVIALAAIGVIRPAVLFEYPIATAALMCAFTLPQIWRIEASGDFDDYPLGTVWSYMIMCVVMTAIGFRVGARRSSSAPRNGFEQFCVQYDLDKLYVGAAALAAVGLFAVYLTYRGAATLQKGEAWGGALAFYVLLATLLGFGAGLAWILYLYTRHKLMLAIAVLGFASNLAPVLFYARREPAFSLAATVMLGIFFVKKKSISRLVLIPALIFGTILINQAGNLRAAMGKNNSTLVSAISEADATQDIEKKGGAGETTGAISDITIAIYTGKYALVAPYYNQLIQSYVPAFILGHDLKNRMKMAVDEDSVNGSEKLIVMGATRTGFADSFQSLHFFGCLLFFGISYLMGFFWSRAVTGDIKAQLYYILLLPAGLKVFTESTSVFLAVMPMLFLSTGCAFWYARRRTAPDGSPEAGRPANAGLSPADLSRPTTAR